MTSSSLFTCDCFMSFNSEYEYRYHNLKVHGRFIQPCSTNVAEFKEAIYEILRIQYHRMLDKNTRKKKLYEKWLSKTFIARGSYYKTREKSKKIRVYERARDRYYAYNARFESLKRYLRKEGVYFD